MGRLSQGVGEESAAPRRDASGHHHFQPEVILPKSRFFFSIS